MTTTRKRSELLRAAFLGLLVMPVLSACAATDASARPERPKEAGKSAAGRKSVPERTTGGGEGIASIYTDRRTASGERFSASALAAAHRSIPFGKRVKVTNLKNGRCVVVRINDRGPYTRGRIIDLTPAAAEQIGLTRKQGLTRVRVEPVES
jgi:rare lipoprotein A